MNIVRSENAILHAHEIEAIKINQDIIKRMAANSQHLKTIFIILTGAILGLFGANTISPSKTIYIAAGFVAIGLVFWLMDAKYLRLERLFREHHKAIINGTIGYKKQWDFNPMRYKTSHVLKVMFDGFSILTYPSLMAIVFALLIISLFVK